MHDDSVSISQNVSGNRNHEFSNGHDYDPKCLPADIWLNDQLNGEKKNFWGNDYLRRKTERLIWVYN